MTAAAAAAAKRAGALPWLRLVRAGTLFSPGCDVVAGLCVAGLPWSGDAARAVAASVCLYAAGMVWNDIADRREDAVQRPERPLPRGDVSVRAAVLLGIALLAGGLLLSPVRFHHGVIAALVLAYDFLLKRSKPLGAAAMGLLRGLNLGTAAALPLAAGWEGPLLAAAIAYGAYIAAVTVLGILEDAAAPPPAAVRAVQCVPPVAALVGLGAVQGGIWPAPALGAVLAAAFAVPIGRTRIWDRAAIRRAMTRLLLGTMLYTALLCVAAGRWVEGAAIAACVVPARWIARRIALT